MESGYIANKPDYNLSYERSKTVTMHKRANGYEKILIMAGKNFCAIFKRDAAKASEILDIAVTKTSIITSRSGAQVDMIKISTSNADKAFQKLMDAGYRVVVAPCNWF